MLSTCAPMIFIGRSTVWTGRHRKSIGVGEANRDPTTCTSLKYSYAEPEGMVHDIDSCKCLVAKQATRSPAKRKLASFDTGSAECQRGSWGVLLCFFFFSVLGFGWNRAVARAVQILAPSIVPKLLYSSSRMHLANLGRARGRSHRTGFFPRFLVRTVFKKY